MRDLIRLSVLVVAIAAGGWYGWQWLFPGDEAEIRAVLDRIAESVHAADGEGNVAGLARAALLSRELAPDVVVDAGPPFRPLRGRQAIVAAAARARNTMHNLEISFPDVEINVSPDRQTARALVTAEARVVQPGAGRGVDARELEVGFQRIEGQWVIASVTAVRPLRRLDGR